MRQTREAKKSPRELSYDGSLSSLAEMRPPMAKANWLAHASRNQSLSKTNKTSAPPYRQVHYPVTDLFCLFAGALRSSLY